MKKHPTTFQNVSETYFCKKQNPTFLRNLISLSLVLICAVVNAQFTPGNVVVLQVGDGSTTLANTGNAIILKEYNAGGTVTYSVGVPTSTSAGNPLIVSGTATSEGGLSLTPNGKYLIFTGYATSAPAASNLASSASSTFSRGIGVVTAAGSYSRIVTSSTFHSGNNIRSAASDGNENYWSAGANDGTNYFGTIATATNVQNQNTNTRSIGIFNGDLYFSASSGTLQGVAKVGSGLPVVSGQSTSSIIAIGTGGSPYAFYFNPAQTICYVADDRAFASGGGIQKWVFSASTWSLAYTLSTGATVGARGVVADFSGTNPVIYATSAEATANRLFSIVDAGSTSTATTLATSTSNTIFRGLAFSPYCTSAQINSVISTSVICANQPLNLDINLSGTAPFTYTWTGPSSYTSSVKNPTVTTASSGNYSITVSNGCGVYSATASVTVNAVPVLSITASSSSVCQGQQLSLTATGASTYVWSGGITNSTNFTPTATTIYSVTGTDANTCSNSTTVNVIVNTIPTLSINSATVCSGQSASLTVSGASSYTWSTGSNSASISSSPSLTTTYSVNASSAQGCVASGTTEIFVNQTPTLSVNSGSICAGSSFTIIASGANTYSWNNASLTSSILVSPTITTSYSVTGTALNNCSVTSIATLVVNALPTLTINTATLCAGSSTVLTSGGATSYTWNTGNTTSSISITPSVTTSYSVSGTSSAGCISSNTTQIVVNANPTITLNSATLCAGSSTVLTASGANTYSWSEGSTTSSISVMPGATSVYTVNGTSSGCTTSKTTTLTVNALPVISSASVGICTGGTATLTVSGASTYTWNTTSNSSSIVVSPTITTTYTITGATLGCLNSGTTTVVVSSSPSITVNTTTICAGSSTFIIASGVSSYTWSTGAFTSSISVTPSSTTVYTVSGNAAGCSIAATRTVAVNVNALPVLNITTSTICLGNSAVLTVAGASSYTWNTSVTGSSVSVSPANSTNYSATGVLNGCVGSATTLVTVNPLPVVTINSATICLNATATLTAFGASTYSWTTGSVLPSLSVSPVTNTVYTVMGTSAVGCTGSATASVNVLALPLITFSLNASSICQNDNSVSLTAQPAGGTFSGTGVSGTSFNPSQAGIGTYTLVYTYTDINSCTTSAKATATVAACTGLDNFPKTIYAQFSPNPVQDKVTLVLDNVSEKTILEIFDLTGKKLVSIWILESTTVLDMKDFTNGLYIVKITNNGSSVSSKLIKN